MTKEKIYDAMLVTDHSLIVKGLPMPQELYDQLSPIARSLLVDAAIYDGPSSKPFLAGPAIVDTDDIPALKEAVRELIAHATPEQKSELVDAAVDICRIEIICQQHQVDFIEIYVEPSTQMQ